MLNLVGVSHQEKQWKKFEKQNFMQEDRKKIYRDIESQNFIPLTI